MKNLLISRILDEIADMFEILEVEWKPRAYHKAAISVENLTENIEDVYKKGKLEDIPGVGESIAEHIAEIIKTGRSKYHEELKKKLPMDFESLMNVEGIGPKTVKLLYKKLNIKNLDDLEKAANKGLIQKIKGLGPTVEKNILSGLDLARHKKERMLLGNALPIAQEIINKIKKECEKISIAGSLRRMKETIGDIDILAVPKNKKKLADLFTNYEDVVKVIAKGSSKCSVRLNTGVQVDLRIIKDKNWGAAMQYFTGSKSHNIELRKIAINKKLKLNEYGLYKGSKSIAGRTEEQVYQKLGLKYIEPEMRENTGEITAGMQNKLPELIDYNEIKGDLQIHTRYSDGANSIQEMAFQAKKLGYSYVGITDHAGRLAIANAMTEEDIKKQGKEINSLNKKLQGIMILHGVEVDINTDGNLALKNSLLKDFDYVLASIHSGFKMNKKAMTNRMIKVMSNDYVNFIGHPTGRIINERKPVEIDFQKVFKASKDNNVFLEINSYPNRLDLNDIHARSANQAGCKLIINTDSHSKDQMHYMNLGIGIARRAWYEKKDILNTQPLNNLLKAIKR